MSQRFNISPGYLLTIAVAMFLFLPNLFREGMFIDGIFYAILSRNLAEGYGSFWAPFFSETYEPVFYAHPPFAIWLESLFFRMLGTAYWVENIFSVLIWSISAVLITQIWQKLLPQWRAYAWLAVLSWLIVPRVFWSFGNNMLENTLTMWTLAAFWATLKAHHDQSWRYWGGIIAGICTLAALHTKGPVGLFPLAMPILLSLGLRTNWRAALTSSLIMFATLALALGLLMLYEPAATFWELYFEKQLVRSFNGQLATDNGRGYLLRRMLEELLPCIGLTTLIGLFSWRYWRKEEVEWNAFLACLLIGLAASIPLLLSPKQRDFYLVPAFPYYALAMSALVVAAWHRSSNLWDRLARPIQFLALAAILGAFFFSVPRWGTPKRDQTVLTQVHEIGQIVPRRATTHICNSLEQSFALRWYLNRYYYHSQDHRNRADYGYQLVQAPCPKFEKADFMLVWQQENLALWQRK
ncbi:MAG: ArnT family glycosyltransferase [Bacteroidia bacterium]